MPFWFLPAALFALIGGYLYGHRQGQTLLPSVPAGTVPVDQTLLDYGLASSSGTSGDVGYGGSPIVNPSLLSSNAGGGLGGYGFTAGSGATQVPGGSTQLSSGPGRLPQTGGRQVSSAPSTFTPAGGGPSQTITWETGSF